MADFRNAVVTEKGHSLNVKALAGTCEIKFTKIATGNGTYTDSEDISGYTSLKSKKQEFSISSSEVISTSTIHIKGVISNVNEDGSTLMAGYYVKEVGIFAYDPEEGEILYALAVAKSDRGDYLPPYNGSAASSTILSWYLKVEESSTNVSIQVNSSLYVLKEDFDPVEEKVKQISSQLSNIIAASGETDGNAELQDIRVGVDGTVYETAGEAVRSQIKDRISAMEKTALTHGSRLEFDQIAKELILVNSEGTQLGDSVAIENGLAFSYLEYDDEYYLHLYDDEGNDVVEPVYIPGGGGGGGSSYSVRLLNQNSSLSFSAAYGAEASLDMIYYEYYGSDLTGVNGELVVTYKKTTESEYTQLVKQSIAQGVRTSIDITDILEAGSTYTFKATVTGGESELTKTLTYTVSCADINLTSTFSDTTAYTSAISFLYKPTGRSLSKTMYFYIDGELYDEVDIGTSHNVNLTETIDLSAYGHGSHVLTAYFLTSDGTKSPTLTYDIIYSTGESTPIISCTFDTTEVDYGDTITVNYTVFTAGSDYTKEVVLGIYTLKSNGEKTYYSMSTLVNVVNQSVQTWNITGYPSSGDIYLEITAGEASKTFGVYVNAIGGDRDLTDITTRLIASYTASGRTNNDAVKTTMTAAYTSKDSLNTSITGTLTGFNFRSNGWVSDDDGYPVLRVSGGAEVDFDLPFFATSWTDADGQKIQLAGTPTAAGRTFEVSFKTQYVTDESKEIISIWDDSAGIGIKVFPSKAYMLSDAMSVTTDDDGNVLNKNVIPYVPYSSTMDKVRLTFIIEQQGYYTETDGTAKQLLRIYVNGQLASAVVYSTDSFSTNNAYPHIKAESCILDVYTMRFYDYALDDAGVLKNYIYDLPSVSEKVEAYDANDIVDENDDISFSLSITKYSCMVITGTLSAYKGNKTKVGVMLYRPDGSYEDGYYAEYDYMETDASGSYGVQSNVQGTSSQHYLKKNYKLTFYKLQSDGTWKKVKVYIFDDRQPVNTVCIKADYMSPDMLNTGNANFWQSILTEKTPAQEEDSSYQTSVMGYPILVFQRDTANDTPTFMGRYCLNNDKSNSNAFGLEVDSDSNYEANETTRQKWEYLDNSEDICNWLTDKLQAPRTDSDGNTYPAWQDALESAYPDQGDLEDEGLLPDLDRMQMHYSWVVQRANFLDASTESGTGGTYGDTEYDTEYDLKLAIFKAEFSKHFNPHHTAHYFIANEFPLLVDNLSKNFFATMYTNNQKVLDADGNAIKVSSLIAADGTVDISGIDWENSTFDPIYPTLYDMDSGMGADNNGYDQFPYYAEMWDTYNGAQIVNGSQNLFWKLWYAAFYDYYASTYRTFRDTDKSLSADQYLSAIIDAVTAALPIVAANKDQRFKYIDAYEGGYYSYETNSWLYTAAYLYLVKSTMESYHRDFATKRTIMLDSKTFEDSYMQDNFNLRVNRGVSEPEDLAFSVSPCQALYCYTEWGNSGSYIGGKCLEGESIEMKPASSGNWSDIVLTVYGASHYKSFGDLSPLYPSKLQNLSLCANLTELILGSDADGYANSLLTEIPDIIYLVMLKKLNICNLTALSGTIDLSNCDVIEEVYATGSAISAVTFPEGGYLKTVHLPGGITNLSIVDHADMEEFTMESYGNLLRVRVENTPNVPTDEILLSRGTSLTGLRLEGVDWELEGEDVLEILADSSWAGKAIDANGNAVDDNTTYPTITGTATVASARASLVEELATLYPNLIIVTSGSYCRVTFVVRGETISTQTIASGSSATAPAFETAYYTEQYIYTFRGWDNSYTNVTSDVVCTAQWTSVLQSYTINFYEEEGDTSPIATLDSINYGAEYRYPSDFPAKDGYVFTGWIDGDGNVFNYPVAFPDSSAHIDSDGNPVAISLYGTWSAIKFPSTSKSLDQLTDGERLFCAIAIQNGKADGIAVAYYEDTIEYILTDTTTLAVVSLAAGDTRKLTLYNGESATQQILDFNHDYLDEAGTRKAGISFAFKNCLTDTRQMNPSYKHCFNFQIGDDEAVVSDDEDHSSATNDEALALLTHSHTVTSSEAAAGYCSIKALGQTYLQTIQVTHSDGTTTTWHMGYKGWYAGEDRDSWTYTSSGTEVTATWFLPDTETDANNPFYKMGKIMQATGADITNWQGTVQGGWTATQQCWAHLIGKKVTMAAFGGIILDATGSDSQNTAKNNPYNGTGESRIAFMSDWMYDWNNFTEMSEGAVISVPVISGDTVTVVCYGYSRNWGGWGNSAMNKWMNGKDSGDFYEQLPIGTYNTIVPVVKRFGMGNRSYLISKGTYRLFLLSNAELKGYTTYHPYMDEGEAYPVFTDNDSRIKYLADGEGDVTYWWERSPTVYHSHNFYNVYTSGYPYNANGAGSRHGVCPGFCSGEADQ